MTAKRLIAFVILVPLLAVPMALCGVIYALWHRVARGCWPKVEKPLDRDLYLKKLEESL